MANIFTLMTFPLYLQAGGKGYGGMLLDYVTALAKEKGYKGITLDSGYTRFDAHRLYLKKGFTLASHHFSKPL